MPEARSRRCCMIGNRTRACVPVMKTRPDCSVYLSSSATLDSVMALVSLWAFPGHSDTFGSERNVVLEVVETAGFPGPCCLFCGSSGGGAGGGVVIRRRHAFRSTRAGAKHLH